MSDLIRLGRKSLVKFGIAALLVLILVLVGFFLSQYTSSTQATSYNAISQGLSVVLQSPTNLSHITNDSFVSGAPFRNINFTFTPAWNSSMVPGNITLFGNFTGSWAANATNSTILDSSTNNTVHGINTTVDADGVYFWNVVFYNATGIENDTNEQNWTVTVDTVSPQYSNNATNVTHAGRYDGVLIYSDWTDIYALDYAVLSTNETGSWQNKTTYGSPFDINQTADQTWSNFTWSNSSFLNDTAVQWKIFANDTAGNENVTADGTFMISGWPQVVAQTTNTTNNTVINIGTQINISANWTDNTALSYWWLWYNNSDTTGANTSWVAFTATNHSNSTYNIDTSNFSYSVVFQARFYANDTSGNENQTEAWQWQMQAAPEQPSQPPSPGGSIVTTTITVGKVTKTYSSITQFSPKKITAADLKASGTHLTEIYISVINRVTNVEITIEKSPRQPADVRINVSGLVYQWINITKKNLEDDNIDVAKMKFKVEKTWINNNTIDANTIALWRWENNRWHRITTNKTGEDSTYIYYETELPGFSVFAIAGELITLAPVCGNAICDSGEDYTTCSADCPAPCVEDWDCGDWGECIDEIQTRSCTDLNGCSADKQETQDCELPTGIEPLTYVAVLVIGIVALVLIIMALKSKVLKKKRRGTVPITI